MYGHIHIYPLRPSRMGIWGGMSGLIFFYSVFDYLCKLDSHKKLLYDYLESGLLHALKIDKEKLSKLGKGNLNAFAKYQWKDFSLAFLKRNKYICSCNNFF